MPPVLLIALVMLLVLPVVAFYLTVESSRRKLLMGLRTCDEVEEALARKPWYVSRGQLVAWEYLLVEAAACGESKPQRHLSRVGPTGRRFWIVWQGAQPTRLFHPWTSAAIFGVGGLVLVVPAYRDGSQALAVAEAAAILGLCGYLLAVGRLQRDDEDWRLGAKLRPLLMADPPTRVEGLRELALARTAVQPDTA
jgi:hypothetical protein